MHNELYKIRKYYLIAALLFFLGSVIFILRGYYHNIWYFALLGALIFILGIVCIVLTCVYPLIYKVEIMIDKIEEDDNKEKRMEIQNQMNLKK